MKNYHAAKLKAIMNEHDQVTRVKKSVKTVKTEEYARQKRNVADESSSGLAKIDKGGTTGQSVP